VTTAQAAARWLPVDAKGLAMDSNERVNVRCSAVLFRGEQVLLLRRERGATVDWVLPGGTPNRGESVASCARREVAEEAGLQVTVDRVAFVLEASNADSGTHTLDLVFTATETDRSAWPQAHEQGLAPHFVAVADLTAHALRPPIAGHLRALHAAGGTGTGAYLGNVWRPAPSETADRAQ
jgi:ADP-ribose pyrophosphatase YjhB (NUDIX family)